MKWRPAKVWRGLGQRLAIGLGLAPATPPPAVLPEITSFFMGGLIQARTRHLAKEPQHEESLRASVTKGYEQRMQAALGQQLVMRHASGHGVPSAELMAAQKLYLPSPLAGEHFASPRALARLVRRVRSDLTWRGGVWPGPLPARNAAALASVVLRAVQGVALGVVRDEYAVSRLPVPETVERAVRDLLLRVDELGRSTRADPPPRALGEAEAELQVYITRATGQLCLPLRSIPTAPLGGVDLEKHYAGRPDEEARRLARQIRHADGAILVTGYRGVGKSSFVNRALHHVEAGQTDRVADGWVVVPVVVNLAKAAGVERILRLTLREVRAALLDPDSARPRPIPGMRGGRPLPLRQQEIARLQEAYIRATLKVSFSRSAVEEQRWELGGKISLDPGKLIGMELGKFLSAGLSKSRADKINREVSLLDYDENAAEADLAALIASLAEPRPLGPGQPAVRIKLVFVFDELDKMNVDTGLKPMIEGLKNLFLQQHAVFLLITSKRLYYDLLKDRAVEDALLNSYFSAIVHVPLLTASQVRAMLDDWIDVGVGGPSAGEPPEAASPSTEGRVLDQLARFLTYRSFGNPRDIIRELRQMQDWADTSERPYLSDRVASRPELPIFAAVQEAVELLAAPPMASAGVFDPTGAVALASERLGGDAARLEQVRRGLYILTEEIINRQTLPLTPPVLEPLQQSNFSLLSVADVQQLASRLGAELSSLWTKLPPEAFVALNPGLPGMPVPLFALETQADGVILRTHSAFYALTGRQAIAAGTHAGAAAESATRTDDQLIHEAEALAVQGGTAERLSAIAIIGQLGLARASKALQDFLLRVVREEADPGVRLAAVGRLGPELVFANASVLDVVPREADERVLTLWIRLLSAASTPEARARATTTLVAVLTGTGGAGTAGSSDAVAVDALGALATVADRDVVDPVLAWLRLRSRSDAVATAALAMLNANAASYNVDLADRIVSSEDNLRHFLGAGLVFRGFIASTPVTLDSVLSRGLRELVGRRPLAYADKLLGAAAGIPVEGLLTHVWRVAFEQGKDEAADFVVKRLLASPGGALGGRIQASLATLPDYKVTVLPQLLQALDQLERLGTDTPQQFATVRDGLQALASTARPRLKNPAQVIEAMMRGDVMDPASFPAFTPRAFTPGAFTPGAFAPGTFTPGTFTRSARWRSVTPTSPLMAAALALSVVPFLATLAIPWDLPPGAGWRTILLSRALIWLMDAAILGPVFAILFPADDDAGDKWRSPFQPVSITDHMMKTVSTLLPLVAIFGFPELHQRWVGPLVLWHQAVLFAVNLVGIALATYGITGGEVGIRRPRIVA